MTDTPLTPGECRSLRLRMGISQQQLAQRLSHAVATISRWERGVCPVSAAESVRIRLMYAEQQKQKGKEQSA